MYDLSKEIAPDKFKPFDELAAKLAQVLGLNDSKPKASKAKSEDDSEESFKKADYRRPEPKREEPKQEVVEKDDEPAPELDEGDDELAFFQKKAAEASRK